MPTTASSRSAAAKKAAVTRKAKALKRSAAAKKAAQTRRLKASRPTSGRASSTRTSGRGATDAVTVIERDHRTVEGLFQRFEAPRAGGTPEEKRQLVEEMIRELSIHAAIEENVLYPAVRDDVSDGDEKVEESLEEHQEAKEILADLDAMAPEDPGFDQKVLKLMADVRHHVQEEETDMLPRLRRAVAKSRLQQLGKALQEAKALAPTRPHPHAPAQPPASEVAGKIAGVVDRIRDRAGGRGGA